MEVRLRLKAMFLDSRFKQTGMRRVEGSRSLAYICAANSGNTAPNKLRTTVLAAIALFAFFVP